MCITVRHHSPGRAWVSHSYKELRTRLMGKVSILHYQQIVAFPSKEGSSCMCHTGPIIALS